MDLDMKQEYTFQRLVNILADNENRNDEPKHCALTLLRKLQGPGINTSVLQGRIISHFNINSLLQNLRGRVNDCHDVLIEFGMILLKLIELNIRTHLDYMLELKWVLKELIKNNIKCDTFLQRIWFCFEMNSLSSSDLLIENLSLFLPCLERTVFKWIEEIVECNKEINSLEISYYVELSCKSSKIFRPIIKLLNVFLINLKGNDKLIGFISYFVEYVKNRCFDIGSSFFALYPCDICRLVSLLMVPPELYIRDPRCSFSKILFPTLEEVLSLLRSSFLKDNTVVLMLLTHFPWWIPFIRSLY